MDAGQDLVDPSRESLLALIEPTDVLAFPGKFPVEFPKLNVSPHGHEVSNVVGKQGQPVFEAAFIQKLGFLLQKILDFLLEQQSGHLLASIDQFWAS